MPRIEFLRLVTNETPREILERDFPDLRGRLPIRGGWGYTLDTACIIDRDDPTVDPQMPFNGVEIEYLFAWCRLRQELIFFREPGERYKNIRHQPRKQSLVAEGGRSFDHLIFDVEAFRQQDLEREPKDPSSPFHDAEICTGETEYWFDITSFLGR